MTDEQMKHYLRENGYPEHIVKAGRPGLIERWNKFVDEVERGYKFGLEDYRNDLDLRAIIGMVGLDEEFQEPDDRLKPLVTAQDVRVGESGGEDSFWDFGYPKNAKGELLGDLRAEGLMK